MGVTKRAGTLAMAAAGGAIAVGGFVARRVLGGRGGSSEESEIGRHGPAPIAKTDGDEREVPPKPQAAESKTPKGEAAKAKPRAAKAKTEARPPLQTGTDAPPKPSVEPGNISLDREHPHRALSNPVGDPDETEYPDPFETREDPRDPGDPDGDLFGAEVHPPTGAASTSEPPPALDPEVGDRAKPPRRENLDR